MSNQLLKHLVRQARELFANGSHGFFQIISAGEGKIGWPKISKPRLYIVLDGAVRLCSVSEGAVQYCAGDCFVPALDVPAEAEASGSFLSLEMDFSVDDITSVLQEMDAALVTKALSIPNGGPAARTELLETCFRVLSLQEKMDSFLARHFKREILFWLITGAGGGQWVKNALGVQQAGIIYEANAWIQRNYKNAFSVSELSARWHMSVSRFQRLFKTAVGMGVIQCRTKLRLNEARRLMSEENFNVTQASLEVGYESVSQFIREYKKLFGVSPRRDMAKK